VARVHGRLRYVALDNPAGSLVDISSILNKADYDSDSDRPETGTFGQDGMRYEKLGLRTAQISMSGFLVPTTSKLHGRNTSLLLGAYDLAADFDNGTITKNIDLPETQGFGESWKARAVAGNRDDSASVEGFHNAAANANFDRIRAEAAAESGVVLSVGYNGFAIGSLVDFGALAVDKLTLPGDPTSVTRTTLSAKYDNGCFLGVSLHAVTAETATADATAVDETASTANGGVAALHITSVSGSGSITVKVMHSTDNVSFTDLGSFTAATAIGSQIISIAAGTTVNRYVRASVTAFSGFTSVTFQVSFMRRAYAQAGNTGSIRHFNSLVQRSTTSTFNVGPSSSTTGAEKLSGECRLSSLTTTFTENGVDTFSATLMSDGTVTEGTF